MGVTEMARRIKQVHTNDVALIKVGKFYHAYGKDAYIVAFLFNYQLKKVDNNINTTGFPESALNKVMKELEDKSINYILIDRSANYEVIDKCTENKQNKYSEVYTLAHRYQSRKNKIDAIYEYLISNIDDDIVKFQIQKIEEII